jgi:ribosome-binding factor A
MIKDGRRGRRVAELLRSRLSEALRREIDDPELGELVLTSVEVTDDLSVARIGVRLLVGDEDEKKRRRVLKHLHRAGGRLRRAVAPRLELRRAPELHFAYDSGHDAARRVEELLREIEREPKADE